MSKRVDGRRALKRLDGMIGEARRALSDAIEGAERLSAELAEIRRKQAAAHADLAGLQIEAAAKGSHDEALARVDAEVTALIESHDSYLADLLAKLDAAAEEIGKLETARARRASALDKAIEAYETRVDEVETALEESEAYRNLVTALADAEAITERARAKLAIAREDAEEKGAPFRDDPLFMYLWKRGFRTPDYRASLFARALDGWVAGLSNYDTSWRNYQRLVELPDWLETHVGRMETREAEAAAALEKAEADALSEAGADVLSEKVDKARTALKTADAEIDAAEAAHLNLAERHEAAERGEAGPAAEARRKLGEELAGLGIPELRVLATQTVTPEDDVLVDRLVTLRKDEMSMELRLEEMAGTPSARRRDLETLERFRRGFKSARMDSPYASWRAASLDEVLTGLLARRIDAESGLRRLKRSMRQRTPRTDPRFGGPRRSGTLDLPDMAGEIGWEILKEIGRASSRRGSPWGGPSLPRGRRTSFPKVRIPTGGSRGGGFKTGGGF